MDASTLLWFQSSREKRLLLDSNIFWTLRVGSLLYYFKRFKSSQILDRVLWFQTTASSKSIRRTPSSSRTGRNSRLATGLQRKLCRWNFRMLMEAGPSTLGLLATMMASWRSSPCKLWLALSMSWSHVWHSWDIFPKLGYIYCQNMSIIFGSMDDFRYFFPSPNPQMLPRSLTRVTLLIRLSTTCCRPFGMSGVPMSTLRCQATTSCMPSDLWI